jgi:hypothetical protein
MTDAVTVALVTATTTMIVGIGRILSAREHKETTKKINAVAEQTDKIEISINSRMTKLIALLEEKAKAGAISAHAEGVLEEKARQENK